MTDSNSSMSSWALSSAQLGRHLSVEDWEKVQSDKSLEDSPKLAAVRAAVQREEAESLKSSQEKA
jgi:hypothetical protein